MRCMYIMLLCSKSSCHLSKFVSAHVRGLVVDTTNPRHNHFEKIERNIELFYPTPYATVPGNNLKEYSRVTPNRCAQMCLEEDTFICRSFDYQIKDGTCKLSDKTGSDMGGLYTGNGFSSGTHHFEMKPMLDCGGNLTGLE
ncbi:hypothetical protein CAPTEDRAFT_188385, partial [Capitella teleta]